MNPKFYPLFILLISTLLSSCKKWLPENRIVGNWKLIDIEKRRPFNNETLTSGYERGTFTFYENGTASFSDTSGSMNGNWNMRTEQHGYYDSDGNWQTQNRTVLIVKMYNFNNNKVIDWYFDEVQFRSSGGRMQAFIEGANFRYCYNFRKQ
jgi:hypothetical protein